MQLIVFDIDGTLTATMAEDEVCLVQTFADVLGITGINTDWSVYPNVAGTALAQDIYRQHRGRELAPDELARFKQHFVRLLEARIAAAPERFSEVPGAAALLEALQAQPGYAVAVATGTWEAPARLKLRAAGIPVDHLPLSTADDGLSREEIVQTAIARAMGKYGRQSFDRVACVGDGVWDVRTAARLGFGCLGIGEGDAAERLQAAGACHVVRDYTDLPQILQLLEGL